MGIKTDFNKMLDLSRQIRKIENDLEGLILSIINESKNLIESAKSSTQTYEIRLYCETILESLSKTQIIANETLNQLNQLHKNILKVLESYKSTDKIETVK